MSNSIYDHGYGTEWTDLYINQRAGYYTSVADFHDHPFYEINLILSGNVKILLKDRVVDGNGNFIVVTKPGTPHFISCSPDVLYSRLYLSFSDAFVAGYIPEWENLLTLFGEGGWIAALSPEQTEFCRVQIEEIRNEQSRFRQRLMILCLLSHLADLETKIETTPSVTPPYIVEALSYINSHYQKKILTEDLAHRLFICRTTLMTAFKKYTGTTLNEYLIHLRLKNALRLLREGKTVQEAAEQCGFCDSSGLNRCFKRYYQMTPRQYLLKKKRGY